ncbi:hypothetical protein O181_104547 [Austropuccinia psidii MF-1]|uniref:Uncharacterized protein n=1 Tax=Austropuccinia psidii MF-1 TaxID=1389203 RepID=A0A9Q3PLJ7_9BASI|nr:hypothetical protein [Austropuccinia psidii MF-1]
MESTTRQASNQKDKGLEQKKRDESKEEAPVSSISKPKARQPLQEGKKNKKKNLRKKYFITSQITSRPHRKIHQAIMNLKDKVQS